MAKLHGVRGDFQEHSANTYFMGVFRLQKRSNGKMARYLVRRDVRECGVHRANVAVGALAGAIGGASKGAQMGVFGAVVGGVTGALGGAGKANVAHGLDRAERGGRDRFWVVFKDGARLEAEMSAGLVRKMQQRLGRR